MKKLIFIAVCLQLVVLTFGQSFNKGNLVGLHILSFDYQPGATEDQLLTCVLNKYIPATNKAYGNKTYMLKGIRGEFAGKLAFVSIFENEASRDRFYKEDGTPTPEGEAADASMKDVMDEINKYVTNISMVYNDYLILNGNALPFQKGNLLGLHRAMPVLNAGATLDQYCDEYINKVIPVWEASMGMHANLSKVIRGNNPNSLGYFAIFPDEKTRDQFFVGNKAIENMSKVDQQVLPVRVPIENKYGKWEMIFTDWIVL